MDLELDVVHEGGDHGFPKFSFQLLLLRVLRLGRPLDHRYALHLLSTSRPRPADDVVRSAAGQY